MVASLRFSCKHGAEMLSLIVHPHSFFSNAAGIVWLVMSVVLTDAASTVSLHVVVADAATAVAISAAFADGGCSAAAGGAGVVAAAVAVISDAAA